MLDLAPLQESRTAGGPSSLQPSGQRQPTQPASADNMTNPTLHWLAAALDELDYGIVVLGGGMKAVHVNDAALADLEGGHPLELVDGQLCARLARDVAPLHDALAAAAGRGMRKLLTLGKDDSRASVSVVPLEGADAGARAVLVVLGKQAMCESLSVQGFARSCGLTGAETRVLLALCDGVPPNEVAQQQGVAVSTVRSQIGSLRQKTGAESIRALVRQVAVLPPVKGVLRRAGRTALPFLPQVSWA